MRVWLYLFAILAFATPCFAEAYLDDRSNAESLIRSLYNALNLHQYARAYDYFSEPPAKDFASYARGYDNTEHVDVLVGESQADGAAGSTFYSVPTALRSKSKDGKFSYFAGCYTVRAINADQEPPYKPLHINQAKLKPIKADDYVIYALPKCSEGSAQDKSQPDDPTELLIKAKALFVSGAAGQCDKTKETQAGLNEPEVDQLSYRYKSDDPKSGPRKATLFKFVCSMAAYNETDVFYISDENVGIHRLSFSEPQVDFAYFGDESVKLKSSTLKGFVASAELINAGFDKKTGLITSFSKWRGLGDAFSAGEWLFADGQFILENYAIDPTFDDKQNPISILKNGQIVLKQ